MSELKDYDIMDIEAMDDERLEKSESGKIQVTRVYIKSDVDASIDELKAAHHKERHEYIKMIAELEESHKKEVERLQMKIAGLEKLVETANKLLKQKGGFTIKDITFDGVKLEGVKNEP